MFFKKPTCILNVPKYLTGIVIRKGAIVRRGFVSLAVLGMTAVVIMTASGCDLIKSLKDSITKSGKKEVAPAASTTSANPSTESSNNTANAADVLARVGNWTLTATDFKERLNALKELVPEYDVNDAEAKKLVLEELIRQQILVNEAEQRGIANDKDINAAVEEFRRTLIVREVARQLTLDLKVSDEEAKAFYEENKAVLISPPEFHVREIVVEDETKANELLMSLEGGADFAELASKNSVSESAANGGDVGFIAQAPFPEMVEVLLELETGKPSRVVKGPDGFYIVKIEEKRGGESLPFDQIKEQIIQNRLLFKQQQALLDYIEKARARTAVQINESLLQ